MTIQRRHALIGVSTALETAGAGVIGDLAGFSDPNDDRIFGWDDSADAAIGFDLGAGLITSGTNLLLDSAIFTSVTTAQLTMAATEIELNGVLDFNGAADFSSTITAAGQILAADGSFTTPAYSFTTEGGASGIYVASSGTIAVATGGIPRFFVSASSFGTSNVTAAALTASSNSSLEAGSASVSAVASGNEVDLTGTTIDVNGNLDADGTTLDIDGATSLGLHGGSADITLSGTEADITAATVDINGNLDLDGTTHTLDGTTITVDAATTLTLAGGANTITVDTTNARTSGTFVVGSDLTVTTTTQFGGTLIIAATAPRLRFTETDASATNQVWDFTTNSEQWLFRTRTDADGAGATFFTVDRTGTTVDQITLAATELQFDGTTFDLNSNMTVPTGWTLTTEGGTFTIAGTGETLATFADDGACTLYHNNAIALATTTTGADIGAGATVHFRVDGSSTATHTRMLVYDVDNATLERVTVGAADSGGAGFKVLRIPN